jgi:hypothetical protein
VNKVVDKKIIIRKRRAEEEELHKGSLTQIKIVFGHFVRGRRPLHTALFDIPGIR